MNLPVIALVIAISIAAGGGLFWYLSQDPPRAEGPPITAEAKAYVKNLKIGGVDMKAATNYASQMVVEITGTVTNAGDRAINSADLNCIFYDAYGQMVLRQRVAIIKQGLKPGETKPFRLPFDNLPGSWNQALPALVIAHITFA